MAKQGGLIVIREYIKVYSSIVEDKRVQQYCNKISV